MKLRIALCLMVGFSVMASEILSPTRSVPITLNRDMVINILNGNKDTFPCFDDAEKNAQIATELVSKTFSRAEVYEYLCSVTAVENKTYCHAMAKFLCKNARC